MVIKFELKRRRLSLPRRLPCKWEGLPFDHDITSFWFTLHRQRQYETKSKFPSKWAAEICLLSNTKRTFILSCSVSVSKWPNNNFKPGGSGVPLFLPFSLWLWSAEGKEHKKQGEREREWSTVAILNPEFKLKVILEMDCTKKGKLGTSGDSPAAFTASIQSMKKRKWVPYPRCFLSSPFLRFSAVSEIDGREALTAWDRRTTFVESQRWSQDPFPATLSVDGAHARSGGFWRFSFCRFVLAPFLALVPLSAPRAPICAFGKFASWPTERNDRCLSVFTREVLHAILQKDVSTRS